MKGHVRGCHIFLSSPSPYYFRHHHYKTAVNVIISWKKGKSLRQVADGVQHQAIPLRPKRKGRLKRQKVHKSLEHITPARFLSIRDTSNILGGDTSLKKSVPYLIPTGNIGKGNGKIIFSVPLEGNLPTYFPRRFHINAPFFQISKQYAVGKRPWFSTPGRRVPPLPQGRRL